MITKSVILGGAMAIALTGAGLAQTTNDVTPAHKTAHHAITHHYGHHVHHALMRSVSVSATEPSAERSETNNLNHEQLRSVLYAPGSPNERAGMIGQPPHKYTGNASVYGIPNAMASFPGSTAAGAGGRADSSSISQVRRQ